MKVYITDIEANKIVCLPNIIHEVNEEPQSNTRKHTFSITRGIYDKIEVMENNTVNSLTPHNIINRKGQKRIRSPDIDCDCSPSKFLRLYTMYFILQQTRYDILTVYFRLICIILT